MFAGQANATVYGVTGVSFAGDSGFQNAKVAGNVASFTDFFNFTVTDSKFSVNASAQSTVNKFNQGIQIKSFDLVLASDHNTVIATGTVSPASPVSGATTYFLATNTFEPLAAGIEYALEVKGQSFLPSLPSANPTYSTYSLSITTAPVPEPEEWAMMLVGAGLVGYQIRRKQKALSQSIAA